MESETSHSPAARPSLLLELALLAWSLYLVGPIYDTHLYRAIADGNYLRSHGFLETDLGTAAATAHIVQSRWLFDLIASWVSDFGPLALIALKALAIYFAIRLLFGLLAGYSASRPLAVLSILLLSTALYSRSVFTAETLALPFLILGMSCSVNCRPGVRRLTYASRRIVGLLPWVLAVNISPLSFGYGASLFFQASILRSRILLGLLATALVMFVVRPDFANGSTWFVREVVFGPFSHAVESIASPPPFHVTAAAIFSLLTLLFSGWGLSVLKAGVTLVLPAMLLFVPGYEDWSIILFAVTCAITFGEFRGGVKLREGLSRLSQLASRPPALGVGWLLLCLIVVFISRLYAQPFYSGLLPTRAVDVLIERLSPASAVSALHESPVVLHPIEVTSYLRYRFADAEGQPLFLTTSSARIPFSDPARYRLLARIESDPRSLRQAIARFKPAAILLPESAHSRDWLEQQQNFQRIYAESGGENLPESHRRSLKRWIVYAHTGAMGSEPLQSEEKFSHDTN